MTNAAPGSNVAVLGASPKKDRFSFKAVHMLKEYGHSPIPVHPAGLTVDGIAGVKSLDEIKESIDTVSIYVNSKNSDGEFDKIIGLKPRRVIFNPGAENDSLAEKLKSEGIIITRACTLVLLQSGKF